MSIAISAKRKKREKGTSLLVGVSALVFMIPMTGLTIDVGMIYAVKAKLQGAVDGAALAAARALNLGQDVNTETTSAQTNATAWFNANFPTGTWATSGTSLGTVNVNFSPTVNGTAVQNMIQITISATTTVPTWFMKWLHFNGTLIGATGQTTRRDINAMLVLDRSTSMSVTNACPSLISAAMTFTGAFVDTRDRIGAISFSDGTFLHSAPAKQFQETLGYVDAAGTAHNGGSGVGLNNIACTGGTGTAQAISMAYNELYKIAQPGAFNVIVLETDGLPNTLTLSFQMGTFVQGGVTKNWNLFGTNTNVTVMGSDCLDTSSPTKKTPTGGGFTIPSVQPTWNTAHSMSTGGTPYISDIPAGMYGAIYSQDPTSSGPGTQFELMAKPFHSAATNGLGGSSGNDTELATGPTAATPSTPGCSTFGSSAITSIGDLAFLPATDIFGNSLFPTTNPYLSNLTRKNVTVNSTVFSELKWPATGLSQWQTFHNAALNAADNAAYNARVGTNLSGAPFQVTIDVIGLGGNTQYTPDYVLLQRIANDPNKDQDATHSPLLWNNCSSEGTCVSYPTTSQPQGQFIWADSKSDLADAFNKIASQVLRLSK